MSFKIKKYYKKKVGKNQYLIKVLIHRLGTFGCIKEIIKQTLDGDYRIGQEISFSRIPRIRCKTKQFPISKKEAKLAVTILNSCAR